MGANSVLAWVLAALCLAPSWASAQAVALAGMLGRKALLVVDANPPRALGAGDEYKGVKVLAITADEATVEVKGARRVLRLGEAPVSVGARGGSGKRVVLMADNRTLVPISSEVQLARQYLAIEEIRLGDRLKVTWRTAGMPDDALVPPLMLQPLVENAVYHGIEPSDNGGEIEIDGVVSNGQLVISLRNPFPGGGRHSTGNRMAIVNIRERLQLHFDAEASMRSEVKDGMYKVTLRMPYLAATA